MFRRKMLETLKGMQVDLARLREALSSVRERLASVERDLNSQNYQNMRLIGLGDRMTQVRIILEDYFGCSLEDKAMEIDLRGDIAEGKRRLGEVQKKIHQQKGGTAK